ncbi:hypothetical protein [Falsibacillus pallidus]|uniref:Hpr(Ser) kinase/phosphatase n=1 Tax=Falsibacillus pallidus TaxID=493781 RepID=A0A370GPW8_9BACI|nr:hypothetical protein [Falsibacillus pallidus]RDI45727.1 hypothetical protein DFR59_102360 [Falsibacillus pallidus]
MNIIHTLVGEQFFQIANHSSTLSKMLDRMFYAISPMDNQPDLYININDGYGTVFLDYEVVAAKENSVISFKRADYLIEVDEEFSQANIFVHNELALKHALMNLYSSFLVHKKWGLLIHSSCVIDNGAAHIFAGPSGSGKSTAAILSHPREILSDEAAILKISENGVQVYNSPFRSEIDSRDVLATCQLRSIQMLIQAEVNERKQLSKSDALLSLIDKVFYWPYSSQETETILKLLEKVVRKVPVYQLYFQKNDTFWELIS